METKGLLSEIDILLVYCSAEEPPAGIARRGPRTMPFPRQICRSTHVVETD